MIRSRLGRIAVAGIALGAFATVVAPASAQSPNAAGKRVITVTNELRCLGNTPPGAPIVGFVNIRSDDNGPVVAEVSLKDGAPNTTYDFRLVQIPSDRFNCFANPTTSLTTNGQGNDNVRLSAARLPDTVGAFVFAFTGDHFLVSGRYIFLD